jgi:hypothetical protein
LRDAAHFGIRAEPLRVEAAIFPNDRNITALCLGTWATEHDAQRPLPMLGSDTFPRSWKGIYLLDTTFDQVNVGRPDLRAEPPVIDLRETKWFDPNPPLNCPWTGCLSMFGSVVRYTRFPRQVGFKSAGDFRPLRCREVVGRLIALAGPILELQKNALFRKRFSPCLNAFQNARLLQNRSATSIIQSSPHSAASWRNAISSARHQGRPQRQKRAKKAVHLYICLTHQPTTSETPWRR